MYDIETRRRLAEEIADAFCEGDWRAQGLAERAAERLDRRPEWLERLAGRIEPAFRHRLRSASAATLEPAGRRALVHEIERLLGAWRAGPGDASPPGLIRDVEPEEERSRPDPAPATGAFGALGSAPEQSRAGAAAGGDGGTESPPPGSTPTQPAHSPGHARAGSTAVSFSVPSWPVASFASPAALAERLELSAGQLAWLADVRGLERAVESERLRNYRYRWVPRRSGPPRLIEAPKLRLKEAQRIILREVLEPVPAHEAACGFVAGRSVRDHAARHRGREAILRLDLRDFFASVSAGRVFGIFRALGYAPAVAHLLTGLCTNRTALVARRALSATREEAASGERFALERRLATPHLPQGAPTSPALANLAAHGLDRRLAGLAHARGLLYSRYADDIALSGEPLRRGANARAVTAAIRAIVRDEGFVLHPGKSRLRTSARRQMLTGIVVNERLNVPREEYDRLRATLHRAALDGPGSVSPRAEGPHDGGHGHDGSASGTPDLRAHLHGRVAWVASLNPERGAKLWRLFAAIDWSEPPPREAGATQPIRP